MLVLRKFYKRSGTVAAPVCRRYYADADTVLWKTYFPFERTTRDIKVFLAPKRHCSSSFVAK